MYNKLRTRLTLLMVGVTIFAILLVAVITNITLFDKFDIYMRDEQDYKREEIVNFIKDAYKKENQWSSNVLEMILSYPALREAEIIIRDNNNKILLNQTIESDMITLHKEMMERMGHRIFGGMGQGMMEHTMNYDQYSKETYYLEVDNKTIGSVEIGLAGMLISEREVEFTRGINKSIVYAALFSIILAFLLAQYFSKLISNPISTITKVSHDISRGNLKARVIDKNTITELKELSNSINHLAISLEEQDSLRKRLTADVAHELRTPLTILYGQVEAITDGVWEPTKERMEIFKYEVSRLMKLVEQLKDLSEIEEEIVLEKEQFNFSQLIKDITQNFKYQCVSKDINLVNEIQENIIINADKHRISQILVNLLSNALKFTDSKGQVTVRVYEKDRQVVLEVEDTGVGIAKRDIPYIFERLYRVDRSRNKKTGGAGIGLTITKKLVEAHNGQISVQSEEGKGSRFIVTFK